MTELQNQELAKRIRLAFKNVKYPGRKIGDKEELRDFLGKTREEVTMRDLNRNREFIFFNMAGLQYYLPVYMLAFIEQPEQISRGVGEDFIEYLARESEVASNPCEGFDVFSQDQKHAVLEFLLYLAGNLYPLSNSKNPTINRIERERRKRVEQAVDYWRGCIG
jgi:hypothetical protein